MFAINAWDFRFSEETVPSSYWFYFAHLDIEVFETYTAFIAVIGGTSLQGTKETILFPGELVRTCVTREQLEDKVNLTLVVDGERMGESEGDVSATSREPTNFSLVVGQYDQKYRLNASAVNMYSPPCQSKE